MHKENYRKNVSFYAKILIVLSILLLSYGLILDSRSETKLVEISPVNTDNVISITTVEDSNIISNSQEEGQINPRTANDFFYSIDEENEKLRSSIEKKYDVSIQYGEETKNYVVSGICTFPIQDDYVIHSQLVQLDETLGLYPDGFFSEIKTGGIPLTILLIDHYAQENITGITDSNYSYAHISIASIFPFEESFFHESYHYIERYLFKKGANFNSWDILNPASFEYGTIYNYWSFSNTLQEDSPFVNNYAQTDAAEDRASTFEYMMAKSKASCLNSGQIVWKKARYMANTIETVFTTVSPNTIEYWERYLN